MWFVWILPGFSLSSCRGSALPPGGKNMRPAKPEKKLCWYGPFSFSCWPTFYFDKNVPDSHRNSALINSGYPVIPDLIRNLVISACCVEIPDQVSEDSESGMTGMVAAFRTPFPFLFLNFPMPLKPTNQKCSQRGRVSSTTQTSNSLKNIPSLIVLQLTCSDQPPCVR